MRIPSNKVSDVVVFFRSELGGLYEKEELELFIWFCFQEYLGFRNKTELVTRSSETMSESELLRFNFAVKDLKKHKPIQYILGKTEFYGLPFVVNEHVLIPRPETEELVDLIIRENTGTGIRILDIGTGSGCIPISLKKNLPLAELHALDISLRALEMAERNARLNQVDVHFMFRDILQGDPLWEGGRFDVLVSNPPYIRPSEKKEMQANVLDYEPGLALFAEKNDPLQFYKAILIFARQALSPSGKLYVEINQAFGKELVDLYRKSGYSEIRLIRDMNGKDRILAARSSS
jgi:release factor glutamine methyltransferase